MQLCAFYLIFLLVTINCIENTFKIDFLFLLPDYNTTNHIGYSSNELQSSLIENKSLIRNIKFYHNIKPMTDFCIGDPFQCFHIPISFNEYETVISLLTLNFNYEHSSSFSFLPKLNLSYGVTDRIKLSNRAKNLIEDYNFILTNESNYFLSNLSVLGLGRNRLYNNYITEKDISFSLIKQLKDKKLIDSTEITIKYTNDFSGEITLGTNYSGMKIHESLFLELPNNENSLNGFLQSIYIEDTTISSTKRKHIDLLEREKRKKISIDFNTTFIIFTEEIFEELKTISFNSYINAGICDLKKDDNISYLICKNDIHNSNLDKLFFMINHKKNIAINLNDLFLPYKDKDGDKNNIFGIISRNKNNDDDDTINIGSVLLKKYMVVVNREKNSVRLYMKNIGGKVPTDFFGIGGIIALTTIILILIIYMVTTICGKDKYEPNYSPKIQKFLNKKNLDTSMQSSESF